MICLGDYTLVSGTSVFGFRLSLKHPRIFTSNNPFGFWSHGRRLALSASAMIAALGDNSKTKMDYWM